MTSVAKISRVLVGVGFDDASVSALGVAGALAQAWNAEITVFHAATLEVPAYFTAAQMEGLEAERAQSRAQTSERLRALVRNHASSVNVVVGDGPPQDGLLRMAEDFDLIVVGTARRHGPQRWWLGSVAEAVVRRSPCPVLVVPSGASSPHARSAPVILAAGGGAAGEAWADALLTAFGGSVVRSAEIERCEQDRVRSADLIVLSLPVSSGEDAQFGAVVRVLKECVHPVLFVPSRDGTIERSRS